MPGKKNFIPILHPIQLISLNVMELSIKVNQPPKSVDLKLDGEDFNLRSGRSEYDEKNHIIQVGVKLEIGGEEGQKSPFILKVVIGGVFKVDETKFAKEHIQDWAKRNAPIILYPYLREQAYALTARCGFPGIILPLLEVPTFRIEPSKKIKTVTVKLKK
ncbi:MAG: protein-export chaperone SecB [Desulfobaccales bacterium]